MCEFCKNKKLMIDEWYSEVYLEDKNIMISTECIHEHRVYLEIQIKYCPLCGEELK